MFLAQDGLELNFPQLVKIAATTLSIFALSIGPFLYLGQGAQLLSRLFPFTRGLMHAYWAPNAWALVAMLDRVLLKGKPAEVVIGAPNRLFSAQGVLHSRLSFSFNVKRTMHRSP